MPIAASLKFQEIYKRGRKETTHTAWVTNHLPSTEQDAENTVSRVENLLKMLGILLWSERITKTKIPKCSMITMMLIGC